MSNEQQAWSKNNPSMGLALKRYEEMKQRASGSERDQFSADLAFVVYRVGEAILDEIQRTRGEGS